MIEFRPMSITEKIKRLWPPYRRRRDAEMKEAIRRLVQKPELPVVIDDHFIPNGYGLLFKGVTGRDWPPSD